MADEQQQQQQLESPEAVAQMIVEQYGPAGAAAVLRSLEVAIQEAGKQQQEEPETEEEVMPAQAQDQRQQLPPYMR